MHHFYRTRLMCLSIFSCILAFVFSFVPAYAVHHAWTYDGELYDASHESFSGFLYWNVLRQYKDTSQNPAYIIRSMDLLNGNTTDLQIPGYLLQDDVPSKIVFAQETENKIVVYEADLEGNSEHLFTVKGINSYSIESVPYSAQAYYGGYLYFLQFDPALTEYTFERINLDGDHYIYQTTFGCLSREGLYATCDFEKNIIIIENPATETLSEMQTPELASSHSIMAIITWLDHETILFSSTYRENNQQKYILHWYNINTKESGVYTDNEGRPFTMYLADCCDYYSEGNLLAYRDMLPGEDDYYGVPAIIDLNNGQNHVLAETMHTKEYDEFCYPGYKTIWLQ